MLRLMSSKPWLINGQAKTFARLHAQINQESGEGLPQLRARIAQKINNVKFLPELIKRGALERLDQLPDGGKLCHYDFHPDQVMVRPGGEAIIDWMSALQGVPEADIAHTSNLLTLARPPKTNWIMEKVIDAARGSFFHSYKAETLVLRPNLKWGAVELWRIPMAAARLHENITGEREAFLSFLSRSIESHSSNS
jgi:Ser/Thr protein kinase RdoA (MazF antagonist)